MDMRKLTHAMQSAQRSSSGSNSTQPLTLTDLPPSILDALLPGYSLISRSILASTGLDITWLVSLCIIALALTKGIQYASTKISRGFRYVFISSVYIKQQDDLFDMTLEWLSKTQLSTSRRRATAKTQRGPRALNEVEATPANALGEGGLFDYVRWSARVPPRYEPYYGRHIFWHNRRLFIFHRSKQAKVGREGSSSSSSANGREEEEDVIQLDCVGRSIEPIKEMLNVAKAWSLQKLRGTTTIRHPLPKERQRFGGMWSKISVRPSRPMSTVILDAAQKEMLVKDMNDYLHPSSPQWYATRGLPYRRGYLFHGPPGTGKTSLSFALAGLFGLEIYVIGLQEPTLTEGDLMALFNSLPKRCVVLLEDVDAAEAAKARKGIESGHGDGGGPWRGRGGMRGRDGRGGRKGEKLVNGDVEEENGSGDGKKGKHEKLVNGGSVEENGDDEGKKIKDEEFTLKDLARELKSLNQKSNDSNNDGPRGPRGYRGQQDQSSGNRPSGNGISLSGLLNAIDGVASHEGRVLIMTTNHPEQLDAALIRPGRVDRRIEFTYAMNDQIRELFVRMYDGIDEVAGTGEVSNGSLEKTMNGSANGSYHLEKLPNGHADAKEGLENSEFLERLAEEFASHIPDATYTPAEIQNHLMRYKDEPRVAVEKVDEWIEEQKASRAKQEQSADKEDDNDGSDDE